MNKYRKNADGGGLLDAITGGKEIPFSISLDMTSVTYLGVMVFVVGVILIIISKKVIK